MTAELIKGLRLADCYEIAEVISHSDVSVIYRARDMYLNCDVAIKEYCPNDICIRKDDGRTLEPYDALRMELFDAGMQRFIEDAAVLVKLIDASVGTGEKETGAMKSSVSVGIPRIYNIFNENNTAYIVMEFLEGRTLESYLNEYGKIPADKAVAMLEPVMHTLKFLHENRLIHRNVSPDNIFLLSGGDTVLFDFGTVRYVPPDAEESFTVLHANGYAPAEIYMEKGRQGAWSDVYSLAAVLYRMVTGVIPASVMNTSETVTLRNPRALRAHISNNQNAAIMNALNYDYRARTQSVSDFCAELYGTSKIKMHYKGMKPYRDSRRPIAVVGAAVALALILGSFIIIYGTAAAGSIGRFNIGNFGAGIEPGSGMTLVPNLVNQDIFDGLEISRNTLLYMVITGREFSDIYGRDRILRQDVEGGTQILRGSEIGVTVSAGNRQIYAEDVRGIEVSEAVRLLEEVGFAVECVYDESSVAPDCVAKQSISELQSASYGDTIVLTVSKGMKDIDTKKNVILPDLTKLDFDSLVQKAKELGIYFAVAGYTVDEKLAGRVYSYDPGEGAELHQGDTVRIIYAIGEKLNPVPDFRYADIREIGKLLSGLKISVRYVYEYNDTVADNVIIRQDIENGSFVKDGTVITLYVSRGAQESDEDGESDGDTEDEEGTLAEDMSSGQITGGSLENGQTGGGGVQGTRPANGGNTQSTNGGIVQPTEPAEGGDSQTGPDYIDEFYISVDYIMDVEVNNFKYEIYTSSLYSGYIAYFCNYTGNATEITVPSTINFEMNSSGNQTAEVVAAYLEHNETVTKVNLPSSIKLFGVGTGNDDYFAALKSINIDSNNPDFTSYKNILYNKDMTKLVYSPLCNTEVEIAKSCTEIGMAAFCLSQAQTVRLPDGLKKIESDAFEKSNIRNMVLPDSLESIGSYAFAWIHGIGSMHIPSGVKSIGDSAFFAAGVSELSVDSANAYYYAENNALYSKDKKNLIQWMSAPDDGVCTVADGCTNIERHAFYGSGAKVIKFPASVREIDSESFYSVFSLEEIIVDDRNPYFKSDNGILYSKDGSRLVKVPDGWGKTDFTIPDGVSIIGRYAFAQGSIETVTIPEGLTTIEIYAFHNSRIRKLTLPSTMKQIQGHAFECCSLLTEMVIPDSVTDIGVEVDIEFEVFSGCDNLVIVCNEGSYAHQYAVEHGIRYSFM